MRAVIPQAITFPAPPGKRLLALVCFLTYGIWNISPISAFRSYLIRKFENLELDFWDSNKTGFYQQYMGATINCDAWKCVKISPSGNPVLQDGENELLVQSNVGLYNDDFKITNYQTGRVYITNQRIIFISGDPNAAAISVALVSIESVEYATGFLKSSPKVVFKIKPSDSDNNNIQKKEYLISWTCSICCFTNELKTSNYDIERMRADFSSLPTCANCGVKSDWETLEQYLEEKNLASNFDAKLDLLSNDGTSCPDCTFINHLSMLNCEICGAILKKVEPVSNSSTSGVTFQVNGNAVLDYLNTSLFKISFRNGGSRVFYKTLQEKIKEALWDSIQDSNGIDKGAVKLQKAEYESNEYANSQVRVKSNERNFIGIHGLTKSSENNSKNASTLLNDSIQDIDQLMSKAENLIEFSERNNLTLVTHSISSGLSSSAALKMDNPNLQISVATKGLMSLKKLNSLSTLRKEGKPTDTKSKMPLFFLEELSRHISEFLLSFNILEKNGGLVTLQELFLLYNKARRTNLVSPEEVYDAVFLFQKLNLSFKVTDVLLRSADNERVPKKIYVVSKKSQNTSIDSKLIKFIEKNPGRSVLQLQNDQFGMSYTLLKTILDKLVYSGDIVIDSTIEGVLYWPNGIKPME